MILKNLNKFRASNLFAFIFICIGILSCEDDIREVTLYEKGTANATASTTDIEFGETVDFASIATKVQTLSWTFEGGSPSSSYDENVSVTYSSPGTFEAKLIVKYIDNTIDNKTFSIAVNGPDTPLPLNGTPAAIPGAIEAENYNIGGQGIAYNDVELENLAVTAGSATYRDDDGIDVQVSADGTLINISYTNPDEWAYYTVDVAAAGSYDFDFQVASGSVDGGKSIKLQLLNLTTGAISDLGETGDFANTGGWGTYISSVISGVNLAAGENTLRVYFTGGETNLDKINVIAAAGGGGGPVGPLNIALVSDNMTSDDGYVTLLQDAGHTVETVQGKYNSIDAAGVTALNGFDLIIITRNTNSGLIGGDEVVRDRWMSITKPVLVMSSLIVRNSRLQLFNTADFLDGGGASVNAIVETHPIFTDIALTGGNTGAITASTMSVIGTANAGNGTLIGTDGLSATVAEWDPNTAAYTGAGVHVGKRMYLAGTNEGYTYNDIGSKLFLNVVEYIVTGNVGGSGGGSGETLGMFTERSVTNSVDLTYEVNSNFVISEVGNAFEGSTAKAFIPDPAAADKSWAMASIKPTAGTVDISAFASGYYNIAMKSDSNGTILFRIQQGGTRAIITFNAIDNLYGFVRDGQWHMLKIPMADIIALQPGIDLTQISDILVLRSDGDVSTANNYEFYVDDFYLSMD
jgi:hypothetical protein